MGGFGGEFGRLSLADKNAYLLDSSPTFKSLSPQDRAAYLQEVHYGDSSEPGRQESASGVRLPELEKSHPYLAAAAEGPLDVLAGIGQGVGDVASLPYTVAKGVMQSPLTLGIKPLVIDPMQAMAERARASSGLQKGGYAVASALPVIGPMAASIGEEINRPEDIGYELGKGLAYSEAPGTIKRVRGMAGNRLRPVGERLASSAIGRIPAREAPVTSAGAGRALAAEGVPISLTEGSLAEKVGQMAKSRGQQIGEVYKRSAGAAPEQIADVINPPLERAIAEAKTGGETALANRLSAWRDTLLKEHKGPLTLEKLHDIKSTIGSQTNWATEDPNYNMARQDVVRAINQRLEERVPGAIPLQRRAQALGTSAKVMRERLDTRAGGPILGGTVFGTAKLPIPSTLLKTLGARMLAPPVELPEPQVPISQRLLGTGGIQFTPPPEDVSRIRVVQPERATVRDPKTGRMKRIYLGTSKE